MDITQSHNSLITRIIFPILVRCHIYIEMDPGAVTHGAEWHRRYSMSHGLWHWALFQCKDHNFHKTVLSLWQEIVVVWHKSILPTFFRITSPKLGQIYHFSLVLSCWHWGNYMTTHSFNDVTLKIWVKLPETNYYYTQTKYLCISFDVLHILSTT